jgi:hypothetical protein
MIDGFMLSAQAEYGQQSLQLEPIALGSILHEVAHDVVLRSKRPNIVIRDRAHQPVMTNRLALRSMLVAAVETMLTISSSLPENPVELRSFSQKDGSIAVGVFTYNDTLSKNDLDNALMLQGSSYMALPNHSSASGAGVMIADGIARALGGSLEVKRLGRLRGLSTTLPRSDQLAWV